MTTCPDTERSASRAEATRYIRECVSVEELDACVRLQREAFGLPDLELSPRRHLVVARAAGGWVLGAFDGPALVGFVLHLAAARGDEVIGYSHMMAVAPGQQDRGVGARLKWAQRERALAEGRRLIRWTWEPMRARNAHFHLNRLGVGCAPTPPTSRHRLRRHAREQGARAASRATPRRRWTALAPRRSTRPRRAPDPPGAPAPAVEIPPTGAPSPSDRRASANCPHREGFNAPSPTASSAPASSATPRGRDTFSIVKVKIKIK